MRYRFTLSELPPPSFEVSFVPALVPASSKPIKRQIITEPSSAMTQDAPENARFEAEKNRVTQREQIKRGAGQDAAPAVGKAQPQPPASASATKAAEVSPQTKTAAPAPAKKQTKQITSLRLSPEAMRGEFAISGKEPSQAPPARDLLRAPNPLAAYRPFSRPAGSGARFLGTTGSSDYLPHLPDGDITLLNAKANKFAVFVRRVATRVFSKLRASGWESLSSSDISRMRAMSSVRAILSPTGKLLEVKLEAPSGSKNFDEVLFQAVKNGASDPHPPPGALAADGNIHFHFKARSWSQMGRSRGGKGFAEQRWLLLATGLG